MHRLIGEGVASPAMGARGAALVAAAWLAAMAGILPARAAEAPLSDGPVLAEPWKRYGDWRGTSWGAFSTLSDLRTPPAPKEGDLRRLDGPIQGDAAKGKELAFSRSRGGGCVSCHVMGPGSTTLPGNVGPDLSQVATLGHDDTYLFNYVWDARVYNPETVMPPWGAHGLYTEAEVTDIVAFLKTLKAPAEFKNPLDDPAQRPVPEETRDNLDPLVNPGVWEMESGMELFAEAGPAGKACVSCHEKPEAEFATWAAGMPRWEPRLDKVIGVEEFVARHAPPTTGQALPLQSDGNLQLAMYLRNLANGTPIQVDVESPGAREAAARGAELMTRKIGQLNFACVDCHSAERGANKWIRGQWLGESVGQIPHFPTWRTSRSEVWDIRKRFQWCNVAIRANELPPDAAEYGEIELYLTSLNGGMPLNVPGIRH